MKDTIKRKLEEDVGEAKIKIDIDFPASNNANDIVKKAQQFISWAIQPNQTKLDLSTTPQVTLQNVTMHVDKPKKSSSKINFGVLADKVSFEDQSTLFNLFQTNKKVHIIVRQIPEPKKVKDAKETGETKNTELKDSTAEKK